MARPAGSATAGTSGAVLRSTDLAASLLAWSPVPCALAGGAIAAGTANKAAAPTAHNHPRLLLAIFPSLEAFLFMAVSATARDDNRTGQTWLRPKRCQQDPAKRSGRGGSNPSPRSPQACLNGPRNQGVRHGQDTRHRLVDGVGRYRPGIRG